MDNSGEPVDKVVHSLWITRAKPVDNSGEPVDNSGEERSPASVFLNQLRWWKNQAEKRGSNDDAFRHRKELLFPK